MESFKKKLKSGLRNCPLHGFLGAMYEHAEGGWFQCKKCGGYYEIGDWILDEIPEGNRMYVEISDNDGLKFRWPHNIKKL